MKRYPRTEKNSYFTRETVVTEDGKYIQRMTWADGSVEETFESTIFAMGWDSLRQFLAHKPQFVLVECETEETEENK